MYDFRVVVEISTSNPFSRDSRSSHPKRLSSTGALRAAAAVAVILQFTTGGIANAITASVANVAACSNGAHAHLLSSSPATHGRSCAATRTSKCAAAKIPKQASAVSKMKR